MRGEITAQVAKILRQPHGMKARVEVWRDGVRVDDYGDAGLPIRDGKVRIDAKAKVRRQVSLELPPTDDLWRLLTVPGTEVRPYRAVCSTDLRTTYAWVPLGRMELDSPRIGYSPNGSLAVSGGDYWRRVQANEFVQPGVAEFGTLISSQAVTFLQQALPGVTIVNLLTSPYYTGSKVWEQDRAAAITELVEAIGGEVLFDAVGRAVLRLVPQLSAEPVWTVDAGADGVLLTEGASREQTLQNTRNLVVVTAAAVEGEAGFAPVYAWDDDPDSPTYAGPDPVNNPGAAGPFGVRPERISSPLITTSEQAQQAATTRLAQVLGATRKLALTAVPNPGLEDGDPIAVQLPRDVAGRRAVEAHIVDACDIPLTASGVQQIDTRAFGPVGS